MWSEQKPVLLVQGEVCDSPTFPSEAVAPSPHITSYSVPKSMSTFYNYSDKQHFSKDTGRKRPLTVLGKSSKLKMLDAGL